MEAYLIVASLLVVLVLAVGGFFAYKLFDGVCVEAAPAREVIEQPCAVQKPARGTVIPVYKEVGPGSRPPTPENLA